MRHSASRRHQLHVLPENDLVNHPVELVYVDVRSVIGPADLRRYVHILLRNEDQAAGSTVLRVLAIYQEERVRAPILAPFTAGIGK